MNSETLGVFKMLNVNVKNIKRNLVVSLAAITLATTGIGVTSAMNVNPQVQTVQAASYIPTEGVRWDSSIATVYIGTRNATIRRAAKRAIKNWNRTGAFYFELTNKRKNADIYIYTKRFAHRVIGQCPYEYDSDNKITHATVYIDPRVTREYGFSGDVATIEHELGHAIGLDHSAQGSHDIMEPVLSRNERITKKLVRTVKHMYRGTYSNSNADGDEAVNGDDISSETASELHLHIVNDANTPSDDSDKDEAVNGNSFDLGDFVQKTLPSGITKLILK